MTLAQVEIDRPGGVTGRLIPFTGLSVTATTSGAAQTFAVAGGQGAMLVKRLVVTNTSMMGAVINIHAVPPGGAITNSNAQIVGKLIPGNDAIDLTDLVGGYYISGTSLLVWAGMAGSLTLSGHWEDVF